MLGWQQAVETNGESELCLWSAERQANDDATEERQRKVFKEGLEALHQELGEGRRAHGEAAPELPARLRVLPRGGGPGRRAGTR